MLGVEGCWRRFAALYVNHHRLMHHAQADKIENDACALSSDDRFVKSVMSVVSGYRAFAARCLFNPL